MTKVIFLNPTGTIMKDDTAASGGKIEESFKLLVELCKQHEISIVILSPWGNIFSWNELSEMFSSLYLIDSTRTVNFTAISSDGDIQDVKLSYFTEIISWVVNERETYEVSSFCIIDTIDNIDQYNVEMQELCILTDPFHGLQPRGIGDIAETLGLTV